MERNGESERVKKMAEVLKRARRVNFPSQMKISPPKWRPKGPGNICNNYFPPPSKGQPLLHLWRSGVIDRWLDHFIDQVFAEKGKNDIWIHDTPINETDKFATSGISCRF